MGLSFTCSGISIVDNNEMTAETVQRQMREIRRELRNNVSGVVSGANQLLDWKSYVRRNPWLIVGSAVVVGYMLVPRRSRELDAAAATQESLDNLAEEVRTRASVAPTSSSSFNITGMVMPVLGGVLTRVGAAVGARLTEQILESLASTSPMTSQQRPGSADERRDPAASNFNSTCGKEGA